MDRYYWRNVGHKPCGGCGQIHELVTKDCIPVLFEEAAIRHEWRLAPDEFVKADPRRPDDPAALVA
jgi:hypothetical protein